MISLHHIIIQHWRGKGPERAAWSRGSEIEWSDIIRWLHAECASRGKSARWSLFPSSGSFCVATRASSTPCGGRWVMQWQYYYAWMLSLTWSTFQFIHSNVELDDTATLKAISDLGIDVPSDDDGGLDGTGTSDPFLNLNLGDFIEDVFSTKPTDKTDVAVEYNVPDMGPLPPLLPSLVRNSMLSTKASSSCEMEIKFMSFKSVHLKIVS